jgi:chemotaxis regulatin CheY-phosphate phosphatase CheZ
MIPMTSARAKEVLYDSETMLRLVDNELNELRDEPVMASVDSPDDTAATPSADLTVWLGILQRASAEIGVVLDTLHHSRQALNEVAFDRLHDSTAKIQEVSSAAEVAATNILDSVDRAQQLVDTLDQLGSAPHSADEATRIRTALRDELFGMTGALQFQDITAQQLGHVSNMLGDVEARLHSVTTLLGGMPGAMPDPKPVHPPASHGLRPSMLVTYSESASTIDADGRQATADALIRQRQTP